jgi:tetratricopeptide (TPR) repeat protein
MKLKPLQIRQLLAPVYQEACLNPEVKMLELSEVLENIADLVSITDATLVFNRLRLNRSRYDNNIYRSYLIRLRQEFFNQLPYIAENKVTEAFATGYGEGLRIWQEEYFNALANNNGIIYSHLCNVDFGFDEKQRNIVKRYYKIHKLILDQRWNDVFPFFCELIENAIISDEIRSKFAVYAGQVILYHSIPDYERAKEYFENAITIYEDSVTISAMGEYYMKVNQYDKARDTFQNAISMEPNEVRNYLLMGDSFLGEFRYETAEQWYTDALNINFLSAETFHKLILLYGYPELAKSKPEEIERLVKSAEELEIIHQYENSIYELYRHAGLSYSYSGNYKRSLEYYQLAADSFPEYPLAYIDKGYILTYSNQYDEAEVSFKKALTPGNENFDAVWGLAYFYQQKGDFTNAIDCYLKCLELYPAGKETLYYYLGDCYASNRDFPEAEMYYKKALLLKPGDKPLKKLRELYETTGESDKLENILLDTIDQNIDNPLSYNDVGIFYYNRGDYKRAIEFYSQSIKLNEGEPVYHENIGLAFEKSGDLVQAETSYLKALSCKTNEAIYANRLGFFYFQQHEYDKSIEYYSLAVEKDPENTLYLGNIALAYQGKGMLPEAIANYEKSLMINPENAIVLNLIGLGYHNQQKYETASEYYRKAVNLDQNNLIYLSNLGLALRLIGSKDEALEVYQKVVTLKEDDDYIWNELGVLLFEKNLLEKAIECYNKAINIKSDDPVYFENIGLAYEKLGMFAEAIDNFEKALKINPSNARVLNRIGLIHYNNLQYDKAIDYYRKALDLDQDNWIYLSNLGIALRLYGKYEDAIEIYTRAVELKEDDFFIWNELGVLYSEKSELDKAIECYINSINLQPDDPQLYVNLARAFIGKGEDKEIQNILEPFQIKPEVKEIVNSMLKQHFPYIFSKI